MSVNVDRAPVDSYLVTTMDGAQGVSLSPATALDRLKHEVAVPGAGNISKRIRPWPAQGQMHAVDWVEIKSVREKVCVHGLATGILQRGGRIFSDFMTVNVVSTFYVPLAVEIGMSSAEASVKR